MLPFVFLAAAQAATLEVCSTCTYTTVTDGITAATAGDTVHVHAGTWNEAVTLDKDLTLLGDGSGSTVLSANSNPLVNVVSGTSVSIEGFTLDAAGNLRAIYGTEADIALADITIEGVTGNLAGQCARVLRSNVTITGSSFIDCDGGSEGGALHLTDSTLDVTDTVFAENAARNSGAAVYAYNTDVVLTDCSFSSNRTDMQGGAVSAIFGTLEVTGSTFVDNAANDEGGGIWANDGATISDSSFETNDADAGGGLFVDQGDLVLSSSTFDGNTASDEGGGAAVSGGGTVRVSSCTFTNNLAGSGAGFSSSSAGRAQLAFDGNTFDGNRALEKGGALYVHAGGAKTLTGNRFTGNEADTGGALAMDGGGTSTSTGDWFCQNTCSTRGGAAWVSTETSTDWTGALFADNDATLDGGGLAVLATTATVVNVDSLANNADRKGGGIYSDTDLTVRDSLIAFTPAGSGVYATGTLTMTYTDLYQDVTQAVDGAITTPPATNLDTDPQLMRWSPGDGCVGDFRRDPSSPLVDGGDPTETDPDGSVRDIGAFGPITDDDGDGYLLDDCDNEDATVNPGATETCDGRDEDCNGVFDDGFPATSFHADRDGDGFGSPTDVADACVVPVGFTTDDTDCDDGNRHVAPGATESCDGADEDCNGNIDDGAWDAAVWAIDADGDGYGDENDIGVRACTQPSGRVSNAQDCNDTDPLMFPDAPERCNGADDNCDNLTDNSPSDGIWLYQDADHDGFGNRLVNKRGCPDDVVTGWTTDPHDCDDQDASIGGPTTWYDNDDGDAWGDANQFTTACESPDGFIDVAGDCNDQDATIGATVDWYTDADADGWGVDPSLATQCEPVPGAAHRTGDCDDADAARNPSAAEIPGDGIDQDCNGEDATAPDTDVVADTDDTDTTPDTGCKGCATTGAPGGALWLGLGLLALRRRR